MGLTALLASGEGLGAVRTVEHRGATTAACFSDPQKEFATLRSGCGVYDLGYRAKLALTGSDRVRWLNGMVTNNVRDLGIDHGVYAFLLNPQGHILGDLYAYNRGDSIIVDTDRSQLEKISATFDHYIIMDDVIVTDVSDQITALGLAGPKTRSVLQSAGIVLPDLQPLELATPKCECQCDCLECTVVRGDFADEAYDEKGNAQSESYEIWVAPKDVRKLWNALIAAGATPVGAEALELQRIASGVPLFGVDIRERDLPQETEQARALNFNKGCYVGQEIVERIHSRGAVHRKFAAFLAEGLISIPAGTKIVSGEKEAGEVTSAASFRAADADRTVALGYIRRELGAPGHEVTIDGAKAIVVQPPVRADAINATHAAERSV